MEESEIPVRRSADGLERMFGQMAGRFGRVEPRRRALAYVRELVSPGTSRSSGGAGRTRRDAAQRLLNSARWDADAVRDDLRTYVMRRIGDTAAALIVDEIAFPRKGSTYAAASSLTPSSGGVEYCQLGLFTGYAGALGRTLIDRELYLPQAWLDDRTRRRDVGIPDAAVFRSRSELACGMVERTVAASAPFRWVAASAALGSDGTLGQWCHERAVPHVLAVPGHARTSTDPHSPRVADVAATAPMSAWSTTGTHRMSLRTTSPEPPTSMSVEGGCRPAGECSTQFEWAVASVQQPVLVSHAWLRWLLVRRSSVSPGDDALAEPSPPAYFLCTGPASTTAGELIQVGSALSAFAACATIAHQAAGLGRYRARGHDAWYRHITLSLLALAHITEPSWAPTEASAARPNGEIVWHVPA